MYRRFSRSRSALVALGLLAAACGGGTTSNAPAGASSAAPVTNPVNPETAGAITGKVTFEGTAPKPEPIRMSSDPKCQTEGGGAVNESIVVGDGGALQNVFVYVKDGLGNLVFPVPTTPVVMDQKGCHYVPHVFGVQVGQPVEIRNSDPTLHNVHAIPKGNQEFNTGQPIQGMKTTHVFTVKEVLVPFKCDVHNWMNAYVGVVDHPFFSVSAADGSFKLAGVPPGTYTIEAVHEKLGTQTQTVTVGQKETKDIAFTFKS
jgi:plastocyanin